MNKVLEWLYNKPTIRLQFENDPTWFDYVTIIMRNVNYASFKRIKIDHFKYIDDDEFINISLVSAIISLFLLYKGGFF